MENRIDDIIERGYEKVKTFDVTPIGKPRMTQSDKWKKRPRVEAYFAFRDLIRLQNRGFSLPESLYHLVFYIPIPKSWSNKKKKEMLGQPHRHKPDKDNIEKAFLDAMFKEDAMVWDGRVTKLWAEQGRIDVYVKQK